MKGLALLPSLWAHAQMGDDDDADYEYDADDDTRTRFARSGPRSLEASQARGVVLVLELESELVPLLVQIQVLVRVRFCPEGKGKARPPFGTTVQLCKRSRPHSATTVLHSRRASPPSRRASPLLQRQYNTSLVLIVVLSLVLEDFSWEESPGRTAAVPERGRGAPCLFPLRKVACSFLERGRSQEPSEHHPTSSAEQRAHSIPPPLSLLERGAGQGRCLPFPVRNAPCFCPLGTIVCSR